MGSKEYLEGRDGNNRDAARGSEWAADEWFAGFQTHTLSIHFTLAFEKPEDEAGTLFEWYKGLADKPEEVKRRLCDDKWLDGLCQLVLKHLGELKEQAFATGHEANAKFVTNSDAVMSYGTDQEFEEGLIGYLGFPHDTDPLGEMYREHCEYDYAVNCKIVTDNYGISTDLKTEWQAVCGMWTPDIRSFALIEGCTFPRETRNIAPDEGRIIICLDSFLYPTEEERARWEVETEEDEDEEVVVVEEAETAVSRAQLCVPAEPRKKISATQASRAEREAYAGRKTVWKARLIAEELIAIRLWTGPNFYEYNRVLRGLDPASKGRYTTTLHALCSAAYKLSRIGTPEVVYRGLSGRAIAAADFARGAFVERGAQSFTRDVNVARAYSSWGAHTGAHYVLEIKEGHIDQGADISSLSFYPKEKEKFYRPLSYMQLVGTRIEGARLVLCMRVNVNTKVSTLEEVRSRKKLELVGKAAMLVRETASSELVRRAGANSKLPQLELLRASLLAKSVSEYNELPKFVELNETMLRTYQGVNYHADALGKVEVMLTNGDSSCIPAILDAQARLRALRREHLRRAVSVRMSMLAPVVMLQLPVVLSLLVHACLFLGALLSCLIYVALLPLIRVARIPVALLEWIKQPLDLWRHHLGVPAPSPQAHASSLASFSLFCARLSRSVLLAVVSAFLWILFLLRAPLTLVSELLLPVLHYTQNRMLVLMIDCFYLCGGVNAVERLLGLEQTWILPDKVAWKKRLTWGHHAKDYAIMKQLAGELLNADTAADNADKSSVATGVLALPCKYRHLSDHELGQEASKTLRLLATLWQKGGVAAKEELSCGLVGKAVYSLLADIDSVELAKGLHHRRLLGAIRYVEESCGDLPLSASDTRVQITEEARGSLERWGQEGILAYKTTQDILEMTCVLADTPNAAGSSSASDGRIARGGRGEVGGEVGPRTPAQLGEGEEGEFSNVRFGGRVREVQSLKRVLELFTTQTSEDGEFMTEAFDLWDSGCLGHLSVTHEYLDGIIHLETALTGKLDRVSTRDMTCNQAAFLVRFVGEHGQEPIRIDLPPCKLEVVLPPHSESMYYGGGGGEEDGVVSGKRDVLGLLQYVTNTVNSCTDVEDVLNLDNKDLSLGVLRLLAEVAEHHTVLCETMARRIRVIRMDGNSALGGSDGGREAAMLLLRIMAVMAPRVEAVFFRGCGLGDAAAAVFATGLEMLPHLRYMNLLTNAVTGEGDAILSRAWRNTSPRRPPVRMRTAVNEDEGLMATISVSLLPSLFRLLGDMFCGTKCCLCERTGTSGSWWCACCRDPGNWRPEGRSQISRSEALTCRSNQVAPAPTADELPSQLHCEDRVHGRDKNTDILPDTQTQPPPQPPRMHGRSYSTKISKTFDSR